MPLHCLIVDDSRVVRTVAKQILVAAGVTTAEAENGKLAIDYCQSQGFADVVLLDWNMPVMNGLEFVLALRAMPGGDAPKVIFCTTESDTSAIERAIKAGADEYIMKPFDKEILLGKLQQLGLLEG